GGRGDAFPLEHEELLDRCREAGQERPTPLILRYGKGDWNALHQDLYGEIYFPFQVVTVLSEPFVDHEGGELVLVELRPRAPSPVERCWSAMCHFGWRRESTPRSWAPTAWARPRCCASLRAN